MCPFDLSGRAVCGVAMRNDDRRDPAENAPTREYTYGMAEHDKRNANQRRRPAD